MNYANESPTQQHGRHTETAGYKLPFLSDTELRAIAEPLRQPAAIARWFQHQGFEIRIKPNGMPLISRSHFEAVMCGMRASPSSASKALDENINSPNSAAFLQRFGKDVKHANGSKKKE